MAEPSLDEVTQSLRRLAALLAEVSDALQAGDAKRLEACSAAIRELAARLEPVRNRLWLQQYEAQLEREGL